MLCYEHSFGLRLPICVRVRPALSAGMKYKSLANGYLRVWELNPAPVLVIVKS